MDRIETLRAFLEENPKDSFVRHALALEYIKMGKDAVAKQLFEDLLNDDENYVGSYYHLGKLLERTGDNSEALRVYEKGMKLAASLGERHALNELRSAYEEASDEY